MCSADMHRSICGFHGQQAVKTDDHKHARTLHVAHVLNPGSLQPVFDMVRVITIQGDLCIAEFICSSFQYTVAVALDHISYEWV